ncbi:MAG: DUF4147 domain-containing protein [Roseiflexaceae bacterium]|nr:DUF4147 domain-containing protein [Roseiflexaceae bacterium]
MHQDALLTHSLRASPAGPAIARVLAAALEAVDPAVAVRRYLKRAGDTLLVGERAIDLRTVERVFVVGAGKAGLPMAQATAEVLGERLSAGVVIVKDEPGFGLQFDLQSASPNLQFFAAAHPIPDQRGVNGTARIAQLLAGTTARDLVIALISGGGSALLTQPVAGVTLAELQQLTKLLLRCGASIGEINALRKHLDLVKGGGLARMASPAQLAALILSDVVGSPLDVIASGPTVADHSTFADALAVLERYDVTSQVPMAILAHLRRGLAQQVEETLKPGDWRLAQVSNLIIGSNFQAAQAALAQAAALGFNTLLLTTFLQGEARAAGQLLAAIAREVASSGSPLPRPACLVAGGETTVTLRGEGLGGRNQELALAAVVELAGLEHVALITLATDGGDGPTDAAGAVVTGETLRRAGELGLLPEAFLARNDAYNFFQPLGDLLLPGLTRTNVNDLTFIFAW